MKKLVFGMVVLTSVIFAGVHEELSKLEAEQRILQLKIENYKLQKKVVEYEEYLSKKRKLVLQQREREAALIQLKKELSQRRNQSDIDLYPSAG